MNGGKFKVLASGLAVLILAACGTPSATPLPEARPIARPLLSDEEQKKAIAELERRRAELDREGASQAK